MYASWKTRRVTVEEAEAANMLRDERLGDAAVAFGFLNAQWRELVAQMRPGDELWEFDTPEEWWKGMMGRMGYVVIREGVEVGALVRKMN